MIKTRFFLSLTVISIILFVTGCEKETVRQIIPNNQPLTDTLVTQIKIENYINKCYISILGRRATEKESLNALNILKRNNASLSDREQFLDLIFRDTLYTDRIFEIARANYLRNTEIQDIKQYISALEDYIQKNPSNPYIELQKDQLKKLKILESVPEELKSGRITIIEMQRRCIDNYFYDQINMGSQNFVLSVYENLSGRYPTGSELNNGMQMVEGRKGVLFQVEGYSKDDFINIYFNSIDYSEGQVIELMKRYLFRTPTSTEMAELASFYQRSKDYKKLQIKILTKDEYLGL